MHCISEHWTGESHFQPLQADLARNGIHVDAHSVVAACKVAHVPVPHVGVVAEHKLEFVVEVGQITRIGSRRVPNVAEGCIDVDIGTREACHEPTPTARASTPN